jgi:hypothetical protein
MPPDFLHSFAVTATEGVPHVFPAAGREKQRDSRPDSDAHGQKGNVSNSFLLHDFSPERFVLQLNQTNESWNIAALSTVTGIPTGAVAT